MAERNGSDFRRVLDSAERFSERAILLGSSHVNTLGSRSRALLFFVTAWDHLLRLAFALFIARYALPEFVPPVSNRIPPLFALPSLHYTDEILNHCAPKGSRRT